MKCTPLIFFVLLFAMVFSMPLVSNGQQISLNEDFEGAEILQDQNWANNRTSVMPTAADVAKKGLNIAYVDGVNISPEAKSLKYSDPAIFGTLLGGGPGNDAKSHGSTISATVVTDRSFSGAKSLALRPRADLDPLTSKSADIFRWHLQDFYTTPVLPNQRLTRGDDWLVQFAVSAGPVDPARTVGSPYGVCQIALRTTIVPSSGTWNAAASLRFYTVVKQDGSGNVDLVLAFPQIGGKMTTITTLSPAQADWALVSILYRSQVGLISGPGGGTQAVTATSKTASLGTWNAVDTITSGSANPIPKGPAGTYPSGISIFCNSNVPAVYLSPAAMSTAFGNDGFGSDQIDGNNLGSPAKLDDNKDNTGLMTFEVCPWNNQPSSGAAPGTTPTTPHDELTYIDDVYIGSPAGSNNTYMASGPYPALNAEIAARIHDFDGINEPAAPGSASAKNWDLY